MKSDYLRQIPTTFVMLLRLPGGCTWTLKIKFTLSIDGMKEKETVRIYQTLEKTLSDV